MNGVFHSNSMILKQKSQKSLSKKHIYSKSNREKHIAEVSFS